MRAEEKQVQTGNQAVFPDGLHHPVWKATKNVSSGSLDGYVAPPWSVSQCHGSYLKSWGEGVGGRCSGATGALKHMTMAAIDPKTILSWELKLRTFKERSIMRSDPKRFSVVPRMP